MVGHGSCSTVIGCGCAVTMLCIGMPTSPRDGTMPITSCVGFTEGKVL